MSMRRRDGVVQRARDSLGSVGWPPRVLCQSDRVWRSRRSGSTGRVV